MSQARRRHRSVEVTISPLTLDVARAALKAQPFSRFLGAELLEFGPDGAVLHLAVRPELRQQDGFVHGGVIAYLIDNAITFAAGSVLGREVLTGGFTVDYLRPASGGSLQARAFVVRAGSRTAVAQCDVQTIDEASDPVLCAIGQGHVSRYEALRS